MLREGMRLSFYCDDSDDNGDRGDLVFEGVIHFDSEKNQWYVIVDETSYRHSSEIGGPMK